MSRKCDGKLFLTDIGLDIQDDMGRHEVGFVENTEKTPLGEKGCTFHATFQINKVPGNFHVSTHSAKEQPDNPDFSHRIVEVRLGDKIVAKNVIGSFNPLEGVSRNTEFGKLIFIETISKVLCPSGSYLYSVEHTKVTNRILFCICFWKFRNRVP